MQAKRFLQGSDLFINGIDYQKIKKVIAIDIGKVWAHFGPWIKEYCIQFEFTAVVSDAEFASMWPGVSAAASAE